MTKYIGTSRYSTYLLFFLAEDGGYQSVSAGLALRLQPRESPACRQGQIPGYQVRNIGTFSLLKKRYLQVHEIF